MRRLSGILCLLISIVSGTSMRAVELAPGVELIPGAFVAGRQPDGNTVILRGPKGLLVMDTGRHPEHTRRILDYAEAAHIPIQAIVNSHWHLDHVGGNPLLKRTFPGAHVFASSAIDDALKGFLSSYRGQLTDVIAKTADPEAQKPWRAEITLIDAGHGLGPDEVVTSSGERTIAGRRVLLQLETRAVTAADVWLFDPVSRVLVAGDLVTLPVPFLDTACPQGWKSALDHVAAKDFRTLVPGHGAPMNRKDFQSYRTAFESLLTCAASKEPKEACVSGWSRDAGDLLATEDPKFVASLMSYDVDVLRDHGQTAKMCGP